MYDVKLHLALCCQQLHQWVLIKHVGMSGYRPIIIAQYSIVRDVLGMCHKLCLQLLKRVKIIPVY